MKKINVLQAFLTNEGGLSSYMLNNYKYIDKNKFNFEFLSPEKIFNQEIKYKEMGAKILYISKEKGYLYYLIQLSNILKKSSCDIIHLNLSAANLPVIILAKKFFKGKIIIHSHSASVVDRNILKRNVKLLIHKFGKNIIPYFGDCFLACSKKAAKWMYPRKIIDSKNYIICKNAIDVEKFRLNKTKRFELRKQYNISDDYIIIGHVAGFVYQKNHSFVIKILKSLQKTNLKFKIFFVGIGEELEKIKINVNECNLSNNVVFLNQRNDVQDLMQLFDILILPSHFEGFGFVVIEAQCSGLPCLVSNSVPQEVKLTDLVHFLSLKDPGQWVRYIIKYGCLNRIDRSKEVAKAGFDIKENIKKIEKLYINIVNSN